MSRFAHPLLRLLACCAMCWLWVGGAAEAAEPERSVEVADVVAVHAEAAPSEPARAEAVLSAPEQPAPVCESQEPSSGEERPEDAHGSASARGPPSRFPSPRCSARAASRFPPVESTPASAVARGAPGARAPPIG